MAHRSHYYQKMTGLGMTHRKVTTMEMIAVAVSCGVAWFYMRTDVPAFRWVAVVLLVGGLIVAGFRVLCWKRLDPPG